MGFFFPWLGTKLKGCFTIQANMFQGREGLKDKGYKRPETTPGPENIGWNKTKSLRLYCNF